ncbi:DUF1304 domain-containing protein [Formosa algae]|uniref:Membrane protein n=1 Tax=Formosa algae TaxID=225843 RepID=A0A9X0YM71_9FLAO|nr:DUF1304 domain-containing protein [Formosa algae]MBP1839468.1 putative membrane protein [Formosa algae]MDQ0334772.1 putative membrane protein [Formosa algae]OEI82021.1 hypothetical protein AST99_00820 [Formosa algae]PNW27478.1 hypothetical protein BKP44_12725 [Formosa algae]
MYVIAQILTALVAVEHLYILWMEMFAWETAGQKTFNTLPKDLFKQTTVLAANQGLYNGFLAAGLIWSFFISDPIWVKNIRIFFLSCVIIAGLYGAKTLVKKIFVVQAIPAILALIFVFLA